MAIKSLFGVWRGNQVSSLSVKQVLGKTILVNETKQRVVVSRSEPDPNFGQTDTIEAETGEAVHFIKEGRRGKVVVGPEAEVASWIRYYYFEPHRIPNPDRNLKIEKSFLKVGGVSVVLDVLKSYSPAVAERLKKLLRPRYYKGSKERTVLDTLLKSMGGSK